MDRTLGEILTDMRRGCGLTQQQVCSLLAERGMEIQVAGVSKWEKNLTSPNAAQLLALCDIYGVEDVMHDFLGKPGLYGGLNAAGRRMVKQYAGILLASGMYSEAAAPARRRVLPLYDLAVSAGTGQFLDGESSEPADALDAPERADFALRIAGDSMEPLIADGAVVWVRSCERLDSGKIGIFLLNGQAYCKRLRAGKRGISLVSANRAYAPITPGEGDDFRVLGEVLGAAL